MNRPERPLYARVLRLRHLRLTGMRCFFLFEGMIALGVLLALTELVAWWAPVALPATVAVMVKINDMVAGAVTARPQPAVRAARPAGGVQRVAVGRAAVSAPPRVPPPAPLRVPPSAPAADAGATVRAPVRRQVAT